MCKQMVKLHIWAWNKGLSSLTVQICPLGLSSSIQYAKPHLFQWTAPFWHNNLYISWFWAYLLEKLCSWRIMASGIFPRVAIETVYRPGIWNEKMKALSDTTIIFFNRKDTSCHWRSLGQQHEDALHQHDSNQLCWWWCSSGPLGRLWVLLVREETPDSLW